MATFHTCLTVVNLLLPKKELQAQLRSLSKASLVFFPNVISGELDSFWLT